MGTLGTGAWLFWVLLPLVVAAVVYWVLGREDAPSRELRRWQDAEGLPDELRTATLAMSECDISCSEPVPLHGRVDQVYRTARGVLISVDTKVRKRHCVRRSDVVQLSVYAMALSQRHEAPVASYGYVRTVVEAPDGDSVRYYRVRLFKPRVLVALWHRYHAIRSGEVRPVCSCKGVFRH